MFNFIKKKAIENRLQDEILYEYVLDEIERNIKVRGLWAKALANSDGNEAKANSLYMQYRVQSIIDYFTTLKITYEEMSSSVLLKYLKDSFMNPKDEQKEELSTIQNKEFVPLETINSYDIQKRTDLKSDKNLKICENCGETNNRQNEFCWKCKSKLFIIEPLRYE